MISKRLGEYLKVDAEALTVSSAAGATSQFYSMEGYDRALVVVALGTVAGALQPVVSISQAANATATPAAITASSAVMGSTVAGSVANAKQAIISITTATTDGNTIALNGTTFTVSTAVSATAYLFGATAGSTAAGGADPIVTSLTSLINTYCTNLVATTVSTAQLRVRVKDGSTTLNIVTSAASPISAAYEKSFTMVEVRPSNLNSTSRGIIVNVSTIATAVDCGLTVIREGAYKPAALQGPYLLATAMGT